MEHYYVEHNGDCWQSVFPTAEAAKSQLHVTVSDALDYMISECGINGEDIIIKDVVHANHQ